MKIPFKIQADINQLKRILPNLMAEPLPKFLGLLMHKTVDQVLEAADLQADPPSPVAVLEGYIQEITEKLLPQLTEEQKRLILVEALAYQTLGMSKTMFAALSRAKAKEESQPVPDISNLPADAPQPIKDLIAALKKAGYQCKAGSIDINL